MIVFGWVADPGTGYWRLRLPLGELAKVGHDVMVSERMPDCVRYDGQADVVVASRTANSGPSDIFRRLAREGRSLMVYEMDDDIWTIPPDNKPAKAFFDAEVLARVEGNLACADLVTVSTDVLAEVVSGFTSAPVVVLPNRVPRWLTELPMSVQDGPVRFGHTGGPSHIRDFGECAKAIRAFLQAQNGAAEFVAYGLDSTPRVASIRGRTRHVPWQGSVDAYLRSLVGLDVGLAPLRTATFNDSKSALKCMEFGALGMPVIASNTGPYSGYVVNGANGYKALDRRDWTHFLGLLASDPELRQQMGAAGRYLACQHLVEDHAGDWLAAYEGAMSGKVAA